MKSTISLSGKWFYKIDKDDNSTFKEIEKKYKIEKLEIINVPSNWELQGLNNYSGTVWFITEFKVDKNDYLNKLLFLKFNGVDYFSECSLNGVYLGKHEGYFQPFVYNVSNIIKTKNLLIVKVNSPFEKPKVVWPLKKKLIKGIFNHHDCRPGGWSYEHGQDKNTGGIWNDVELIISNNLCVEGIKISTKLLNNYKKARLLITSKIFSNNTSVVNSKITYKIISPENNTVKEEVLHQLIPGENDLTFCVDINNPKLWYNWELGEQNLYTCIISSGREILTKETFGIREIKLDDGKQFFINGKRQFLRGTNIIPTQFLSEFTKQKIKKLVSLLKEANINIVRVHAHVNRKELYEEFDSAGILVWQDFSLQWTYDDSPSFISNAAKQIKEMVEHLYNHPSICFWCCHNEPGKQVETLDPFLKDAVLSIDNSRIIRIASNYEEHPYDGWYWGSMEHFASTPMGPLVTEFGAQALPEKKSLLKFLTAEDVEKPNWEKWKYHNFQYDQTFNIAKVERGKSTDEFIENSQEYQAALIKTAIDFYRRKRFSGITGIFQFMFIDCWPSITWSVIDYYGKKKNGFYALKQCYQPVYISSNLRKNQYQQKEKLLLDIYVINDTHLDFPNLKLIIKTGKHILGTIDKFDLIKDTLLKFDWENLEFYLKGKMKPGNYKLVFQLIENSRSKIISENYCFIKVV